MRAEGMMIPVPFHADTVWATEGDAGDVLVAVKPICESLGLAWNKQLQRIKRTAPLAKGISMMVIPSPGGPQETVCLPLKLIPGWLFGVETRRVKPEIRAKLELYQAECYEVLWNHFRGIVPSPRPGERPSSVDVHRGIEAHLHPHQLRVLAAIKAYGHISLHEAYEHTGLSWQGYARAVWVLWYLGVVEAEKDGDVTRLKVVPAEQRPALPMPSVRSSKRLPPA